jgi:hypothetical protein
MQLIDEQYLKTPSSGSSSTRNHLRRLGLKIIRKNSTPDAAYGLRGNLPYAQEQPAASATQSITVIAEKP